MKTNICQSCYIDTFTLPVYSADSLNVRHFSTLASSGRHDTLTQFVLDFSLPHLPTVSGTIHITVTQFLVISPAQVSPLFSPTQFTSARLIASLRTRCLPSFPSGSFVLAATFQTKHSNFTYCPGTLQYNNVLSHTHSPVRSHQHITPVLIGPVCISTPTLFVCFTASLPD
jgi:hypothetical protein